MNLKLKRVSKFSPKGKKKSVTKRRRLEYLQTEVETREFKKKKKKKVRPTLSSLERQRFTGIRATVP